MITCDFEI